MGFGWSKRFQAEVALHQEAYETLNSTRLVQFAHA